MTADRPSEAKTRQEIIDQQLAKAGWSTQRRNLLDEFLLTNSERVQGESGSYQTGREFADYVLVGQDGKPLAIVEAKRTSRDALSGKRQASDYANRIRPSHNLEPFIFLSNGKKMYFWDRKRYPVRHLFESG